MEVRDMEKMEWVEDVGMLQGVLDAPRFWRTHCPMQPLSL